MNFPLSSNDQKPQSGHSGLNIPILRCHGNRESSGQSEGHQEIIFGQECWGCAVGDKKSG